MLIRKPLRLDNRKLRRVVIKFGQSLAILRANRNDAHFLISQYANMQIWVKQCAAVSLLRDIFGHSQAANIKGFSSAQASVRWIITERPNGARKHYIVVPWATFQTWKLLHILKESGHVWTRDARQKNIAESRRNRQSRTGFSFQPNPTEAPCVVNDETKIKARL